MTIWSEIVLQEHVEAPAQAILKAADVLLNIEAAFRRSNLRLDAVRRIRKAGVHTPISEK